MFRDRIDGLVLSELGSYLDPIGPSVPELGRKVLHIFDRGYASSLWLGALHH